MYDRRVKAKHPAGEKDLIMSTITFRRNGAVAPQSICDLREAVGWDRLDWYYPAAFSGYWGTVSGFDDTGKLVAWCAILSDGLLHAVLIDVIVHPLWQRQGRGQALVQNAIEFIQQHKIRIIHVDFLPEHQTFYECCGFQTGLGGIIEG
jgi:GNAT superfamily N-acetyltransferase